MIFKLSLKNVLRNKRRTIITISVIAVGVSMLILALAYIEYIKWGLGESTIHGQTGHFQVMTKDFLLKEEGKILEFGIDRCNDFINKIEEINEVELATPRINFSGLASTGEKSNGILVSALIPEREITLGSVFIDPEPLKKLKTDDQGVIIGKGLAKLLKAKTNDYITIMTTTSDGALNAMDFKIVGTINTLSSEMDKRYAVINIKAAQELLATKKVERILVGLYKTEDLPIAIQKTSKYINSDLQIKKWKEVAPYYNKVLRFFYQIIIFLAPVLMIIVWFSTMNTIMMSILERSSELASLRAMGTSKITLFKMLFTEGIWLGIIGVSIGIALELALSYIINNAGITVPPPPGQTSGYPLMVRNVLANFLNVGFLTILVVSLSTIFPAERIFKINIVKALRGQ